MATNVSSRLYETHEVINQPPALCDYNVYEADAALKAAVQREGAGWAEGAFSAFGAKMGSAEFIEYGRLANTMLPVLQTHDRFGHRRDEVEFHPAWHECMRAGVEAEVHALPWNHPQPGAHVARAAKHYMLSQAESGCCCPLTMTFAGAPGLRQQPDVAKEWLPRITSTKYDSRNIPASEKAGCIMGMAMTEKQGGSDVRANTTRAVALGKEGPGQEYFLTGHKWFVSAPMSDVFLTLAYTEKGLSCFLVPKWLPDGTRNRFFILRLKDKLGNRSNASSEVEYCDTWSRMVGEEGHGVRTIMEMVNHTRLDCSIGTAGIMRQALVQSLHNARNRKAFDVALSDQPLMQNVLADLALESEAATTMIMHVVHFYDELTQNTAMRPLARLATAITKFWICKRAPNMVYEALECLGGSGYVEECILPRMYREAPVNSVWEGSGNVIVLDAFKTVAREPESLPAFLEELGKAKGADKRYDAFFAKVQNVLAKQPDVEKHGRRILEQLALGFQASLLIQFAPQCIADAFCAARLGGDSGLTYGTLPADAAFKEIIHRAMP